MTTSTSPLSRQPNVLDYSSPTQFRFLINQLPKVQYFTTSANVPGIGLGEIDFKTRFKAIPLMGDVLTYEDLTISFIVDENLEDEYDFYLLSKKSMDLCIDALKEVKKKITLNTLKISAPYGYVFNRPTIFVNFIKKAIEYKDLTIFGNGNRKQIFTFSEDVGNCCFELIKKKRSGSYYCMGNSPIKSKYLAKKIIKLFKSKSKIKILNKFNETDTANVRLLKKINNLNKAPVGFDKSLYKIFFYIKDNNILD